MIHHGWMWPCTGAQDTPVQLSLRHGAWVGVASRDAALLIRRQCLGRRKKCIRGTYLPPREKRDDHTRVMGQSGEQVAGVGRTIRQLR